MGAYREAWDADYAKRGRRWAGYSWGIPALSSRDRVLDVGCGNGKTILSITGTRSLSPGMEPGSPEIVGLDFSLAAVRLCSHHTRGKNGVHLVCGDGSCMPFPDCSFDYVLLFHVLGHALLQSRKKICHEARRVTRVGGRVIIRAFSTRDFRSGKGKEIEEMTFLRGDGIPTHYFTIPEIVNLNPGLSALSLQTSSWPLKVRGNMLMREEIHAIFQKTTP